MDFDMKVAPNMMDYILVILTFIIAAIQVK
jgi:hypothetical protein